MASVINTNMASLYAQKNLSGAQNALSTSVERLSSGLRINRAKDDAAGLGISEKIKSQVTSLNQGLRNANDAISMVQTAEGSLSEVSSILQRMKELSVQARNDSLSTTQRSFISDELVALKNEINSIAERTTFNDLSLLKNALRTQVSVPALADATKLTNGASLLSGVSVSGLSVNNTNVGTYTLTTGTQAPIANQMSEAAGKFGGSEIDVITFFDNATQDLVSGNTVTATVAITGGATISATITVGSNDLTANGDGTGGSATATTGQFLNNLAKRLAAEINVQAQAASGVPIAARADGASVYVGGASDSVALTTTVTAAKGSAATTPEIDGGADDVVKVASSQVIENSARRITINDSDAVEGNIFTLSIGEKDYSVVAGYGSSAAAIAQDVAVKMREALSRDYSGLSPITTTANLGTFFDTAAGNGLGVADISLKVNRLTESATVTGQMSTVTPASLDTAGTARTITINDFDVVEGRKATVKVGNPDFYTEYSTIVGAGDTASDVASRLESMLDDNFANVDMAATRVAGVFDVTFAGEENGGDTTISFDGLTVTLTDEDVAADIAGAFKTAYASYAGANYTITDTDDTDGVLRFTQLTPSNLTSVATSEFVIAAGTTDTTAVTATVAMVTNGSVSNRITFGANDNLGMSVIDVSFTDMVEGVEVVAASTVSSKNMARADRTITINQNDLSPGNVVSVMVGEKEYAVKVEAGDVSSDVAYKLSQLLDDDFGGRLVAPTNPTGNKYVFGSAGMSKGDSLTVDGLTFTALRDLTVDEVAKAFVLDSADTNGSVDGIKYGYYSGRLLSGSGAATLTTSDSVTFASSTVEFVARRAVSIASSGSSNVITLGAGLELGLEDISVSVKKITDPGKLTLTANADTGIGGTTQTIDVGTIAAGSAKTYDFDRLGVSFTLNNANATAVNAQSFEAYTPKANTLVVESAMDGEALFQVGAGTRDNVVIDGFKDIRITGYNNNANSGEKLVFDNINTTLNTIARNTTESLSESNFATLENQIEAAITTISDFRSYLGAQQNRIEFAISNIQAQSENLTAANSRIVDTDYAAETANLTKTQIMQQAATAMLAQANQMPNVILALLK